MLALFKMLLSIMTLTTPLLTVFHKMSMRPIHNINEARRIENLPTLTKNA